MIEPAVTQPGERLQLIYAPVLVGVDSESRVMAEAYAVEHNNLTLGGSGLGAIDTAMLWDEDGYLDLLKTAGVGEILISVGEDDLAAIELYARKSFDPADLIGGFTKAILEKTGHDVATFTLVLTHDLAVKLNALIAKVGRSPIEDRLREVIRDWEADDA